MTQVWPRDQGEQGRATKMEAFLMSLSAQYSVKHSQGAPGAGRAEQGRTLLALPSLHT